MLERTIVVDGFSKAYAMTGWRLGYAIMPEQLARTVTLFNNNTFSCVATFVQMAGIAALTGSDEPVLRMNEIFRQRRDRLVNGLNQIPGISCLLPEGAFYAFPNVSSITQDDRALAKFLLEEGGVACGGGSSFGAAGKGYLRFSYAASLEDIDWALESIAKHLPHFKALKLRSHRALHVENNGGGDFTSAGRAFGDDALHFARIAAVGGVAFAHGTQIGVELFGEIALVLHAA